MYTCLEESEWQTYGYEQVMNSNLFADCVLFQQSLFSAMAV